MTHPFKILRTYTADALSPDNSINSMSIQPNPVPRMGTAMTSSSPTPTMQQRIKSIGGVATPLAVSSPVRR